MADPRPLTREELARFLPNQRAIRAFEKLFDLIPDDLESLEVLISAVETLTISTDNKANNALQKQEFSIVITSTDFTTTQSEKVICTTALDVTLNLFPDDEEEVYITAGNGPITINGNGRTISGHESITVSQTYTSLHLVYSIQLDEWFIQ